MFVPSKLILISLIYGSTIQLGATFTCTEAGKGGCSSCLTAVACISISGSLKAMEVDCKDKQVCREENGQGNCYNITESKAEKCECSDLFGKMPDPYDTTKYILCLPDDQKQVSCPTGMQFDKTTKECKESEVIPIPECKEAGFATLPGCKNYFACYEDPSDKTQFIATKIYVCNGTDTEVFDVKKGQCVEAETLITPFSCDDKPDGGNIDTVECNGFHVCVDKKEIGDIQCCQPDQRYDSSKQECVATSKVPDEKCNSVSGCIDKSNLTLSCSTFGTATTPPTAATTTTTTLSETGCNDKGRHPVPGDCKRYYDCSSGTKVMKSCPGILVFDAQTSYCNYASEVTGC